MGKVRIGINGFGRIGRNAFKIAFERSDIEIVAINDVTDTKTLAYLLKHDSNYGMYQHDVDFSDDELIVSGKKIKMLHGFNPAALAWGDLNIDIVAETTGRFVSKEEASLHISAGAKRVVVAGPNNDDGVDTVVLGASEENFKDLSAIISNASSTTNAISSLMAVLDEEYGIQKSLMTTIHSYNASQSLIDLPSGSLREGRSAAENIIPSSTDAANTLPKILPQLEGKFDGLSVRVPTAVVSLADITVLLGRNTTVESINATIEKASKEPFYNGILGVSNEPLVSRDYIGNSHSGVVDLLLTKVVGGNLAKIMVWYDNEWGYSNRLVELVVDAGRSLNK